MFHRISLLLMVLITLLALTGCGGAAQVEIGNLQTYKQPDGLFSIDVPAAWKIQEQNSTGMASVMWTDPNNNGLISATVTDVGMTDALPQDSLVEALKSGLSAAFSSQPGFKMDAPVPQQDGSIQISWSYDATADNNTTVKLQGNSFIEQRGSKLGMLMTALPEAQFDGLKDSLNKVVTSFKINEATS